MDFIPYNPNNIKEIKRLFIKVFSDSENISEGLLIGDLVYDLINTEQLDPWDINITILTDKYLVKIENLEIEIEKLNECLSNSECYEKDGIISLSNKLGELEEGYNNLVDILLEVQEKEEEINGQ
jgi:hypothetical protein